jgi:protein MAK16
MIQDDVIWKIINHGHCSFKSKTVMQTFCRNEYNLTGLCNRHSCPLANARYATVREDKGFVYLYMKTIERAHLPNQLWEKIKLPRNYAKALAMLDEHLEFWAKFQRHKCKQRLTKLHQMIIRMRRLKVSAMHTMEENQPINKRYEKRENKREEKALIAAKLETAIEKELLDRLQNGLYKDIYNIK